MKRILLTAAFITLAAAPAFAADIPVRPPVAAPVVAPVMSWTGFYIGLNGGAPGVRPALRILQYSRRPAHSRLMPRL
jgi:opacity protein-like surface antigen